MKVVLRRRIKGPNFTIGDWIIDGKQLCDTLEDKDRDLFQSMSLAEIKERKVYGETAIPVGKYKIKMTYSPKYKRMMPQVLDVKGSDGIRVHSGNSVKDTLGCVLLGEHKAPDLNCGHGEEKIDLYGDTYYIFKPIVFTEKDLAKWGWISNSRVNCDIFYKLLEQAGGECDFEVIQDYRA